MDTPLNGQQLQAIQKHAQDALQVAIEALQLRKWAVEQAFTITSAFINADGRYPAYSMDEKGHVERLSFLGDPMGLATAVYDFVSKAAVVRVDITGGGK